jgi:hypothetical protein
MWAWEWPKFSLGARAFIFGACERRYHEYVQMSGTRLVSTTVLIRFPLCCLCSSNSESLEGDLLDAIDRPRVSLTTGAPKQRMERSLVCLKQGSAMFHKLHRFLRLVYTNWTANHPDILQTASKVESFACACAREAEVVSWCNADIAV